MRKKFTMLLMSLLAFVGTVKSQTLISDASNLSNEKVYTIKAANNADTGAWSISSDGSKMSLTYYTEEEPNGETTNQHFAFLKYNDNTFLYSLGAKKFVMKSGNGQALSENVSEASYITFESSNKTPDKDHSYVQSEYPLVVYVNGWNLCATTGYWYSDFGGIVTNWNSTGDSGNAVAIVEHEPTAEELIAIADGLALLQTVELTVSYTYNGESLGDGVVYSARANSEFIVPTPDFTKISSCYMNEEEQYVSNGTCTVTVPDQGATINVALDDNLPFSVTTDINNPIWQVVEMHRYNGSFRVWEYILSEGVVKVVDYQSDKLSMIADNKLWCFVGNIIDGFTIYNKAAGMEVALNATTDAVSLGTVGENSSWKLAKSTATDAPAACFTNNGSSYMNQYEGDIKYHTEADNGSTCYFYTPAELIDEAIESYNNTPNGFIGSYIISDEQQSTLNAALETYTNNKTDLSACQAVAATIKSIPQKELTPGYYYIKGTGTGNDASWYASYEGDNFKAIEPEQLGQQFIWKFESVEGGYKLRSIGANKYAGNLVAAAATTQLSASDGGTYTFTNNGTAKFTIKNGDNVMRTEGDGRINYWGSENNETWYLVPVTDEEMSLCGYVAKVGTEYYETLQGAINAGAGTTVTLIADISSPEIITINEAITLDGNGKTLTSTADRAINISGANGVTIKNLTVNASGERAFNVIQGATNVSINYVTATAYNYTVNIAGSAPNAVVSVNNSTLTGRCTVNVSAAGAEVTVTNSIINCDDQVTTIGESYAALCLNKEGIGGKIIATNTTVNVTEGSDSYPGRNGAENGTVTINGSTEDVVIMVAAIIYESSPYYHSFTSVAKAVEFAKAGDMITLIRDITLDEAILIDKNVTLDLNDKSITRADDYEGYLFEVDVHVDEEDFAPEGLTEGDICYNVIDDNRYKTEAGKSYTLTSPKEGVTVTYKRTFGHTNWQVLFVPFDIPLANMSEFEVYSITGMNNDNTAIIVNPVTEELLVANTPYFIKAKVAGDKVIKVEDATLTVPQAYEETYGNYTLYGTYTSMAIADDREYVLSNGQWVQMENANSPILGAFRAYLTANVNGAPALRIVTRGETGIEELSTVNDQQSTVIYDLTGRKVETMDKGIYIVNGRKVVIK